MKLEIKITFDEILEKLTVSYLKVGSKWQVRKV